MRFPLLVLALLLAGCATSGQDAPAAEVENFVRLAPRGYPSSTVEVNVRMAQGAEASWRFNASGALVWDVHTHNGDDLEVLASGKEQVASGTFRAPREGVYSLYLQNPTSSSTADVTYRIEGDFRLEPGSR